MPDLLSSVKTFNIDTNADQVIEIVVSLSQDVNEAAGKKNGRYIVIAAHADPFNEQFAMCPDGAGASYGLKKLLQADWTIDSVQVNCTIVPVNPNDEKGSNQRLSEIVNEHNDVVVIGLDVTPSELFLLESLKNKSNFEYINMDHHSFDVQNRLEKVVGSADIPGKITSIRSNDEIAGKEPSSQLVARIAKSMDKPTHMVTQLGALADAMIVCPQAVSTIEESLRANFPDSLGQLTHEQFAKMVMVNDYILQESKEAKSLGDLIGENDNFNKQLDTLMVLSESVMKELAERFANKNGDTGGSQFASLIEEAEASDAKKFEAAKAAFDQGTLLEMDGDQYLLVKGDSKNFGRQVNEYADKYREASGANSQNMAVVYDTGVIYQVRPKVRHQSKIFALKLFEHLKGDVSMSGVRGHDYAAVILKQVVPA